MVLLYLLSLFSTYISINLPGGLLGGYFLFIRNQVFRRPENHLTADINHHSTRDQVVDGTVVATDDQAKHLRNLPAKKRVKKRTFKSDFN